MTLIELFSKEHIENVCTGLIKKPDKIIVIGKENIIKDIVKRYETFLRKTIPNISVTFQTLNFDNQKSALQNTIDTLSEIIEKEDDECMIDYTGGDEQYLVAAGIVFAEKGVSLHKYNFNSCVSSVIGKDGETKTKIVPEIKIEDYIYIYGGCVAKTDGVTDGSKLLSDEARSDIEKIWEVCRRHNINYIDEKTGRTPEKNEWNVMAASFAAASEECHSEDSGIRLEISKSNMDKDTVKKNTGILKELRACGVISGFFDESSQFIAVVNNRLITECLTVAGRALELKIFTAASEAKVSGKKVYGDVMTGVKIDWDGVLADDYGSDNEIDVMMMYGMTPVFLSCKSGNADSEELYKLNTVANKIGGRYAKKVLVATALSEDDKDCFLRQRAKDMGIQLIEGRKHKDDFIPFANLDPDAVEALMAGIVTGANSGNTSKTIKKRT